MGTERDRIHDAERLPDEAARRLLARASELEAAGSAETSLAELREIAREAGISSVAFEQALAELRGSAEVSVAEPITPPRKRTARFWAAAVPAILIAGYVAFAMLWRLLFP